MDTTSETCAHHLGQVAWSPIGIDYDRIVFMYGPVSSSVSEAELALLLERTPDVPQCVDWLDQSYP